MHTGTDRIECYLSKGCLLQKFHEHEILLAVSE